MEELLTPAKIAAKLGMSDAKIKKAIKELNLEPDQKKGPCSYYGTEKIEKIKEATIK
jgi:hypothetical protein